MDGAVELRRHVNPMQPSEVWGLDLYAHALEVALQNEMFFL